MRTRDDFQAELDVLARSGIDRATRLVDAVLSEAARRSASDVHFEPTHRSLEIRYRTDGVLQDAAVLPRELAPNVVARLKVLADLLTYRLDIPQEGRMSHALGQYGLEMRVSTFPTIHGEKAAVRLFDAAGRTLDLEQLGLPPELIGRLTAMLRERSGAILLTGPSQRFRYEVVRLWRKWLARRHRRGPFPWSRLNPPLRVLVLPWPRGWVPPCVGKP